MNTNSKYQKTLDFLNKLYKSRILKYTLIGFVILIAGGFFFKKKIVIENNIIINAPIEKVWDNVNNLTKILKLFSDTVVEFKIIGSESKVGTIKYIVEKDTISFNIKRIEAPNYFEIEAITHGDIKIELQPMEGKTSFKLGVITKQNILIYLGSLINKEHFNESLNKTLYKTKNTLENN